MENLSIINKNEDSQEISKPIKKLIPFAFKPHPFTNALDCKKDCFHYNNNI